MEWNRTTRSGDGNIHRQEDETMRLKFWIALAGVVWLIQQYDPWLAKFVFIYACTASIGWGLGTLAFIWTNNPPETDRRLKQ